MSASKKYTVKVEYLSGRSGRDSVKCHEGTLDGLKEYFSYIFEIGRSWNKKIKRPIDIKTIASFITNLQKSYEEKESACYSRTYVSLVESEKITG